jgi:hypothetical protein
MLAGKSDRFLFRIAQNFFILLANQGVILSLSNTAKRKLPA